MARLLILAINPGSTSTKVAVYERSKQIFQKDITHSIGDLETFAKITDQFEFRKDIILDVLKQAGIILKDIKIIVGRGGLLKPVPSGIYEVNERMKEDLRDSPLGEHASNLGGLIADDLAKHIGDARAYIADPVVVDELEEVARYSGHPLLPRKSIFHALNQKAIARHHASSKNRKYEEMNLIVVHMGGGITVGAHRQGRVVDVNNGLDGDGPFSPERSGTLPVGDLARLCFSGKYTHNQVKKMIKGKGGFVAYLGTNNALDVSEKAKNGDKEALRIQEAMVYQVCKEIGGMATVLTGKVDGILLTGGIAHNQEIVDSIIEKTGYIANVFVYPGEDEMKALANNGLLLNKGFIPVKEYK
ncbi:MAG: butyrate kinase [Bacteroidales bacterium]|nr:butyrate kinase [Bacteroidales bacterium]